MGLSNASPSPSKSFRAAQICFCLFVILLAIFQFSENTADPDLWGHVTFGQEMIRERAIPKTEIYSWTANGQPWINHEVIAEISLGLAHSWLGGSGLLLLKIVVGMTAFLLCIRAGTRGLTWPARFAAWALGAIAVVEISYGFAARPQIFTALFLVVEIFFLRKIHHGAAGWAIALPLLFLVWINTHGGALAGFGLLGLTAVVSGARLIFQRTDTNRRNVLSLWLAFAASAIALFVNPWGAELLRWLVGSVLWLRPQIEEWNPTPFGWDHAAFFIVLLLTAFAWLFTRREWRWWEAAACGAFALLALRSVRNSPLFCLTALALVPPHLSDALARFGGSFQRLTDLARKPRAQFAAAVVFALLAAGVFVATFTLHKEHPLTMEVPRDKYPVAAVQFIREHALTGKTVVFFDWGEMLIYELPNCPPSIDGRLDTCYSRELIAAHWNFYNDEPFDKSVFNPAEADLALLPSKLAGAHALGRGPGWQAVYFDELAVVLVKHPESLSQLKDLKQPVAGLAGATKGRAAFPDKIPRQ